MATHGHYGRYNKPKLPADTPRVAREEVHALTRLIADAERELSRLKNKRKQIVTRENLRARKADPVWRAIQAEALKKAWADPVKAAAMKKHAGRPKVLPDMTPDQLQIYRRFRYDYRASREHAVREALQQVAP